MCALSAHADGTNPAMPIQAREESVLHAYLGAMQTIASPYSSVHDGDLFSDILEPSPVDHLPLPGSLLPMSLTARFALDWLRASATRPPLVRIRCLQQHEESNAIDESLMLCAVEKISPRPHGSWHYAILRVICPCDLLESVESSKRTGCSQPGVVKNFVRARDCSSSVCHARHALLNALRCSVSVQTSRPSCCLRSLGCSVMNEQLMALCNISVRLKSAANRARQVFGHVPVLSLDPLSAVWQLLSLCCLSQQERAASLAPSASVFSLLELLRLRLDSTKLFCRSCYTYVCDYADFCAVSSASAVSTFINPAQVIYEVVTVKTANVRSGRFTSDEASWFPGFTWSHATCRHCESHLGWAYAGRSNGQQCSFLGLCVAHLAHQPPPSADLLKTLQNSGAIRSDIVEVLVEEILELVSICSEIVPAVYSRLHRIIVANLRVPLSEHERLLLMQLDGNLRLGHSGQHHEDLSGIQMHHEVESVYDDEDEEDEDISMSPPIVSSSCDCSDSDFDCDDNDDEMGHQDQGNLTS